MLRRGYEEILIKLLFRITFVAFEAMYSISKPLLNQYLRRCESKEEIYSRDGNFILTCRHEHENCLKNLFKPVTINIHTLRKLSNIHYVYPQYLFFLLILYINLLDSSSSRLDYFDFSNKIREKTDW